MLGGLWGPFSYFWCQRLAKECAWRHDGLHVLRVLQHMSCAACRPVKPVPPVFAKSVLGLFILCGIFLRAVAAVALSACGICAMSLAPCKTPVVAQSPDPLRGGGKGGCAPPSPALHECRHCGFVRYRGFPCCQSWQPPGLGYLQCWPSWAQATWKQA